MGGVTVTLVTFLFPPFLRLSLFVWHCLADAGYNPSGSHSCTALYQVAKLPVRLWARVMAEQSGCGVTGEDHELERSLGGGTGSVRQASSLMRALPTLATPGPGSSDGGGSASVAFQASPNQPLQD